jgi:hypothetical protein
MARLPADSRKSSIGTKVDGTLMTPQSHTTQTFSLIGCGYRHRRQLCGDNITNSRSPRKQKGPSSIAAGAKLNTPRGRKLLRRLARLGGLRRLGRLRRLWLIRVGIGIIRVGVVHRASPVFWNTQYYAGTTRSVMDGSTLMAVCRRMSFG